MLQCQKSMFTFTAPGTILKYALRNTCEASACKYAWLMTPWWSRNMDQCQAVKTNDCEDEGFSNMLRVILWVLGYFSPLNQFSKSLHLLQICRLSVWGVVKNPLVIFFSEILFREAFFRIPHKGEQCQRGHLSNTHSRQFGAACNSTLPINIPQSLCTRIAGMGWAGLGQGRMKGLWPLPPIYFCSYTICRYIRHKTFFKNSNILMPSWHYGLPKGALIWVWSRK